jgi:hypothetical protein
LANWRKRQSPSVALQNQTRFIAVSAPRSFNQNDSNAIVALRFCAFTQVNSSFRCFAQFFVIIKTPWQGALSLIAYLTAPLGAVTLSLSDNQGDVSQYPFTAHAQLQTGLRHRASACESPDSSQPCDSNCAKWRS